MVFQKIKLQMIKENTPKIVSPTPITSAGDAVKMVNNIEKLELSPVKKLLVIGMDNKNNILMYSEVATGNTTKMHISMDNIFKPLLIANCSRFILAHNNVSGSSTPSRYDMEFFKKTKDASDIMGLEFLDYIVIADDKYTSIAKEYKEDE